MLALGRKKQRVLIALSILPNLFLAFLLSSDPLLTLSPKHHCHLPGPPPSLEMLNATLPWEKGQKSKEGGVSQCKQYTNRSQTAVTDCEGGWDYNVTEGLKNNIVTEVTQHVHTRNCTFHCPSNIQVHVAAASCHLGFVVLQKIVQMVMPV